MYLWQIHGEARQFTSDQFNVLHLSVQHQKLEENAMQCKLKFSGDNYRLCYCLNQHKSLLEQETFYLKLYYLKMSTHLTK